MQLVADAILLIMARRDESVPKSVVGRYATAVKRKFSSHAQGQPEDQLRSPVERLFENLGEHIGLEITAVGEATANVKGRPDFAIATNGLTVGFVELKAPGTGADVSKYRGRNKRQAEEFLKLPNLIYSDGREWSWYVNGELRHEIVVLPGEPSEDGTAAIDEDSAEQLFELLSRFVRWMPVPPATTEELAKRLAPLCRALRNDVEAEVAIEGSPMEELLGELRQALFPDIDHSRFADVYAETVTFALLLAKAEKADPTDIRAAADALRGEHTLLGRVLELLTVDDAFEKVEASLTLIQRYLSVVEPELLRARHQQDRLIEEVQLEAQRPWIYFYEDFLAEYDAEMRRNAGVYYTPVEVVQCQCRLVNELLRRRLRRPLGFADPSVVTLDPATGTGTYLLGVIDEAAATIRDREGTGQVAPGLSRLAQNLYGFEWLVGPYAVAELRIAAALQSFGADPDTSDAGGILLTNTLEDPQEAVPDMGRLYRDLTSEQQRAQRVKSQVPVIVCLGNPPYDRHDAPEDIDAYDTTGSWVRWGDRGTFNAEAPETRGVLRDWSKAASVAGEGRHLKNLYNLYVYFWRWAVWTVFEGGRLADSDDAQEPVGPGIVTFITASSFLRGEAFVGMRAALREKCDEIWIIDLGGEGRGTRKEPNVFAIQTPVCITIAFRKVRADGSSPATVRYHRIRGSRAEKLAALEAITKFGDVEWKECPNGTNDPFLPVGSGDYFTFPSLVSLMPWRQTGCEIKRSWPIAATAECLERRWASLLSRSSRGELMFETRDRTATSEVRDDITHEQLTPINRVDRNSGPIRIEQYSYRFLNQMQLLRDARICDYLRPGLWHSFSEDQVYFGTLLNTEVGEGPLLTASSHPRDRHCFRGSFGGNDVFPLFRDNLASSPNIDQGALASVAERVGTPISSKDFAAYIYGLLGHPGFTDRFWDELESQEIRVPITSDPELFGEAVDLGTRLIWLHTYGLRMHGEDRPEGEVPIGSARCARAIPSDPDLYPDEFEWDEEAEELLIGPPDALRDGGIIRPVPKAVWEFSVSGLQVVKSWIGYRMARRRGRTSSELDNIHPERWTGEMTTQLLELLWVIEHTLEMYPKQAGLLDRILDGSLILESDLPDPLPADHELRRAPRTGQEETLFGDEDE